MQVGKTFDEPEFVVLIDSLEFVNVGQLLPQALLTTDGRSKNNLSSRALSEPKTDGGVKCIAGVNCN